jgi:hypothetical protein
MTDELAGPPSKEDLEREKLQLEIAELKRRWWRRASTLASFLPSLTVAVLGTLLGVGVGWWTGFFDIQRMDLSAQRHNLEAQTRDLKAEEKGLIGKRAELLGQVSQLETERDAARNERDKARTERDGIAANLRDEQAKAGQKIGELNRTVDEARQAARRTPAVVWLDVMKRKRERWELVDTTHAANELLKVLNEDPSLAPLVAAEYEKHSGDDLIASKLLRVLYTTTGDSRWLERIVAKLGEAPKAGNSGLSSLDWSSLSSFSENAYWMESALLRLRKRDLSFLEKVIRLATSGIGDQARRGATVISLANSFDGEFDRRAFGTEESYFALLRLVRDHAAVRTSPLSFVVGPPYLRQEAFRVFSRLNAEGAITIFAMLITTTPEQSTRTYTITDISPSVVSGSISSYSERAQLEGDLRYLMTGKAFHAEAVRLGLVVGESDAPSWQEWIQSHQNLVAEWSEPDLARVRQRLSYKAP